MAFLLTNHHDPRLVQAATSGGLGAFQSNHAREHRGFSLFVGGATQFVELKHDPLAPTSRGPFWIVLDGILPKGFDRDQPNQIAQALETAGNLQPLEPLDGDHVLLLAAPSRGWILLRRGLIGAHSAFQARTENILVLASQARLIAALPGFPRQPDPAFMSSMFSLQLVAPQGHTPFAAIRELHPGETVKGRASNLRSTHEHIKPFPADAIRTTEQWVIEYRDCFENAVNDALSGATVPGVMLSGGLDSGPVSAIAARILATRGERIATVSWRLPTFPDADEWQDISKVGKSINARMHSFIADQFLPFSEVTVSAETPVFNAFDPMVRACYQMAREQGLDTILTGGAGDRIYPDSRWLMYDQLRRGEYRQFGKVLAHSIGRPSAGKFNRYPPLRYLARRLLKGDELPPLSPAIWLTSHGKGEFMCRVERSSGFENHPIPEYVHRLTGAWVVGHSATENASAEGFGLTRRDPFLNQDLVRLMLAMPFSLTFREGQSKWQMRQAMRLDGALPRSIIEKPRTGLLGSVFDAGFEAARPWISQILLHQDASWQEWVEPAFVEAALSTSTSSGEHKLVAARCVGYCLWRYEVSKLPA